MAASKANTFDDIKTLPTHLHSSDPKLKTSGSPTLQYDNKIRKENGYNAHSYTYYPVVIIGAGESGIAMGCRLKEALGYDQFRIFDRQSGIGGTWWINRYPGVACDIPAIWYSFSFCLKADWSHLYPEGHEVVTYLQSVCDKYEIVDKIQLNTDVREVKWLESEQVWELTLQHLVAGIGDLSEHDKAQKLKSEGPVSIYNETEIIRAKIVVSGVGGLVEPKIFPEGIPGRESFKGEMFHSARWRYDIDLKDKNVIVVGTGCSAAQFVPQLTKKYKAKSVTQIMRSPPWVVPRISEAPPGFHTLAQYNLAAKMIRTIMFLGGEYDWRLFGDQKSNKKARAQYEDRLIKHMRATVPEKYHEMLTPNYSVGCKRRIFDASWFPGLNDPLISLTTHPLISLSTESVTLGPKPLYPPNSTETSSEQTLPADVIILANGFETTEWLHPINITGRNNNTLHGLWETRGGPSMYMGNALDSFPNFFTIFGPNTATGHSSVILASENMVELTLKLIKPILAGDASTVEIKPEAQEKWTEDIQRENKKKVWSTGGCRNWYFIDGWNSTVYPYSQIWFGLCCMFPTWRDWRITYTPQGRAKRRRRNVFTLLTLFGLLAVVLSGKSSHVSQLARSYLSGALVQGASLLLKAEKTLR